MSGNRQSAEFKEEKLRIAQEVAKERNGACLSTVYFDSDHPMKWKCELGHEWHASFYTVVKRRCWCKECMGPKISKSLTRFKISDLKKYAASKNGKCLSSEYLNPHTDYQWECECGNVWPASWANIKRGKGQWCRRCSGFQKLEKSEIKSKVLSISYISSVRNIRRTKNTILVDYKCRICLNLVTEANFSNLVHKNSACPFCSGKLIDQKKIESVINARGGKLISPKVIESSTQKLKLECSDGHEFKKSWNKIDGGQWCGTCAKTESLGERATRLILERTFLTDFSKVRPEFLVNKGGSRLEFDGYSETLKIAFEHQGDGHFNRASRMYNRKIEIHDRIKVEACERLGIRLFLIYDVGRTTPLGELKQAILDEMKRKNVEITSEQRRRLLDVNLNLAFHRNALADLRDHVEKNGGVLYNKFFPGMTGNAEVWCKVKGHERFSPKVHRLLKMTPIRCKRCASIEGARKRRNKLLAKSIK